MDVSKLCRSCMEEVAPWEREDADKNTVGMFSFCTNIEISKEDELPKHFCFNCTVLIESSYTYIRKARRINGKLKKLVQNGSTFVDNFLIKTNSFNIDNVDEKPIDIPTQDRNTKTEYTLDHDIFDDDDDRCLSEFKSKNLSQIKVEPISYVDELSYSSLKSKASTLVEVKKEKVHSKHRIEKHRCEICKKNFASKGWYSRHMKTTHSGKGRKRKKFLEEEVLTEDANAKKNKKNKTVQSTVKTEEEMIEDGHDQASVQNKEEKHTENVIDKEIENNNSNAQITTDAAEKFTEATQQDTNITSQDTNTSDKETNIKDSVVAATETKSKAHKKKKSKESKERQQCKLCSKEFASKYLRNLHVHNEHSKIVDGVRVFICFYCSKTFKKYNIMYYHTTKHTEVRKHTCSTCGKQYRIAKELEQHQLTHKADRPYACHKCNMRFKIKGILMTHLKWHKGVRPYLCNVCGHSFMQSGNLDTHMRVHTGERPYPCPLCPFRSGTRGGLKRHELRHRGERPYPCPHCPKRFYESCSLARHIRSHTRERPYKCPYCHRAYYDSGKRRRHLINSHKMAPDEIPPMNKDGGPIERNTFDERRTFLKKYKSIVGDDLTTASKEVPAISDE